MPPVNLLIKPASGSCNMRCRYCFYEDETQNREVPNYGMMSLETAEEILKKTFAHNPEACHIAFQGGEPTLRGLDFFKAFVVLVDQYNVNKTPVTYGIQTNGILIDEEWAAFFVQRKFLVGLSMDGDKDVHDLNRIDAVGKGTFQRVLKTAKLFDRYKVEYNILVVVTAQTTRNIERIYRFFMKNGLCYQQYIPCLDPLGEERGTYPYSLKPEAYGKFLIKLFDLWYADRAADQFVYIRYFENLAALMLGRRPESCGMSGVCAHQLVVEADGSVFPCDFYMLDQYKLGNFLENTVAEMEDAQDKVGFLQSSVGGLEACRGCKYYRLCRGGCRRDRQGVEMSQLERNYYCTSFQTFLEYAAPKLATLLR